VFGSPLKSCVLSWVNSSKLETLICIQVRISYSYFFYLAFWLETNNYEWKIPIARSVNVKWLDSC
jgi:hypothetical protein